MKKGCNFWTFILLFALALGLLSFSAFAATNNPATGAPGYTPMAIPLQGTYSSSTTAAVTWKAPTGYRVMHASVTARAVTGTNPTLTVDVKSAGTSILSAPVAVTAGSITDAVLGTSPKLVDEGAVSVNLAIGGTAPKWRDITLFMLLKQL